MNRTAHDINFVIGVVTGAVMVLCIVWLAGCSTPTPSTTTLVDLNKTLDELNKNIDDAMKTIEKEVVKGCVIVKADDGIGPERNLVLCKI